MSQLYPLAFEPIFKDYIWGGRRLETALGRTIPDGIVAESWEIAAHANGSSTVAAGPLQGQTLGQVQEQFGVELVGTRNQAALEQGRFPLLIKLLDANRWLSVQVHPDDAYGLANENDLGKTEMWVILHAEPESKIVYGFKSGVTREAFAEALAAERCEDWLHYVPVQTGDVVFVPAGSIHALGPGTIVAEIQQNSDTTYRIYDWGRPRPIHVAQALDVLNFDLIEPTTLVPEPITDDTLQVSAGVTREVIGHCAYFHTERIEAAAGSQISGTCDGSTFEIWGILSGRVALESAGGHVESDAINWLLLPAGLGEYRLQVKMDSVLLRVYTLES